MLLFGLETGMLGAVGGLAGAAAGAGLSFWLRALLGRVGPIMLGSSVDPRVLLGGVAVGVVTAVIFGLHAIARASAVRPSTLLRDLPTPMVWGEAAVLYAALGVLFSALAAAVMRSVLYGVGVVAAGAVGLALLVALLGAGFFALVAVPLPLPGIVALARRNLRRNPLHTLVALVALFCGVFTIGFAGATIANGRDRLGSRELPSDGYNVTVYAAPADAGPVAAALERAGGKSVQRFVRSPAAARTPSGRSLDVLRGVTGRDGDRTGTVGSCAGVWGKGPGAALAPARLRGEPWKLKTRRRRRDFSLPGASRAIVSIAGFYDLQRVSPLVPRISGLILDEATALRLGGPAAQVNFAGEVGEGRLDAVARDLARDAPDALVLQPRDLSLGDAGRGREPVRLRRRRRRIGARRGWSPDRQFGGPRDATAPARDGDLQGDRIFERAHPGGDRGRVRAARAGGGRRRDGGRGPRLRNHQSPAAGGEARARSRPGAGDDRGRHCDRLRERRRRRMASDPRAPARGAPAGGVRRGGRLPCVSLLVGPQHGIYPALVSRAFFSKPLQDIGIDTQGNLGFTWDGL